MMVQQRIFDTARGHFIFRVTPKARTFLLQEGTDIKHGARHLKRAIELHLVYPLANLLSSEQIMIGDVLSIDWDAVTQQLSFTCTGENALVSLPSRTLADLAEQAPGGRFVKTPDLVDERAPGGAARAKDKKPKPPDKDKG